MAIGQKGCSLRALAMLSACLIPLFSEATEEEPPPPTPEPTSQADLLSVRLFTAIADFDKEALRLALNEGADPNGGLPDVPEAAALRARYPDGDLYYYLHKEPGYTPLMFAAALGNEMAAKFLLLAGADPQRLSKKSKTFALWQAARRGHIGMMRLLMGITPDSEPARYRVTVDLKLQQAVLWKDNEILLLSPISSGKPTTPTRTGTFLVTDKYRHWKSTIYDAKMPYFLRLSCGDFGLHAGHVPGYPASHGCVRLPEENARQLFSMVPIGTLVEIK